VFVYKYLYSRADQDIDRMHDEPTPSSTSHIRLGTKGAERNGSVRRWRTGAPGKRARSFAAWRGERATVHRSVRIVGIIVVLQRCRLLGVGAVVRIRVTEPTKLYEDPDHSAGIRRSDDLITCARTSGFSWRFDAVRSRPRVVEAGRWGRRCSTRATLAATLVRYPIRTRSRAETPREEFRSLTSETGATVRERNAEANWIRTGCEPVATDRQFDVGNGGRVLDGPLTG
jgi:hypothetical protein